MKIYLSNGDIIKCDRSNSNKFFNSFEVKKLEQVNLLEKIQNQIEVTTIEGKNIKIKLEDVERIED